MKTDKKVIQLIIEVEVPAAEANEPEFEDFAGNLLDEGCYAIQALLKEDQVAHKYEYTMQSDVKIVDPENKQVKE